MKKSVLVTGGTGFIGSHLIKQLLKNNYSVRAIYRKEISKILTPEENKKVNWISGNVLDIFSLTNALQNVDVVFHCAAMVSFDARQCEQLMQTNVEGTANMVDAMLDQGVQKIVYLSSVAALGRNSTSEKIDEDADWLEGKLNSQYAVSKYRSEMEVWRGVAEGLQAVIVNPGTVLGEGDWNTSSNKLFKNIYNEFPFYTKGETAFVDVKDVGRVMINLFEKADAKTANDQPSNIWNERFIVSAGTFGYKKIFDLMAKYFNKKAPRREAKPWMVAIVWRLYEIKKWFSKAEQTITQETARSAQSKYDYDNSKLKTVLPNLEYTPIEKTIERSCKFYLEKQASPA